MNIFLCFFKFLNKAVVKFLMQILIQILIQFLMQISKTMKFTKKRLVFMKTNLEPFCCKL